MKNPDIKRLMEVAGVSMDSPKVKEAIKEVSRVKIISATGENNWVPHNVLDVTMSFDVGSIMHRITGGETQDPRDWGLGVHRPADDVILLKSEDESFLVVKC